MTQSDRSQIGKIFHNQFPYFLLYKTTSLEFINDLFPIEIIFNAVKSSCWILSYQTLNDERSILKWLFSDFDRFQSRTRNDFETVRLCTTLVSNNNILQWIPHYNHKSVDCTTMILYYYFWISQEFFGIWQLFFIITINSINFTFHYRSWYQNVK